jgi:N-acetylglucosamine-6-sulfatase
LLADPLELNNLNRDPAYAARVREWKHLYQRYHDCRGARCRVPVPAKGRLKPAESRRLTIHQQQATNRYFSN